MSGVVTVPEPGLRIGEVARRCGTTTRTIRYYEEIGLLGGAASREAGRHRLYGDDEIQRLRDAMRLRDLLGVSLDELKELMEAEEARAALRSEWQTANPGLPRRRQIVDEALGHLDHQMRLVRRRRDEIAALESELEARRRMLRERRRKLAAE